ncbi:lambda exonuclease family protein [Brucella pseudogrignonensis]|uniref:YqaJ-like viral recombinase domain protein n=1 Tax=Brucella pseudogrignonensis TaxID=419475 RepID=A0A256GG17_9HYPH|nr:lambda exonuclease family protein [Brucella pseudogrignonensis]NKX16239.1 YqaJ viral recombinase family protein [Brucella pseudogrignonensis]OYR25880.1 yqaJ-like viral recombinase domain protein [Brucella pseudogrignonensis]
MEVFDMDQGGDEWFQARLGIPTASKFATVMAKGEGKTRSEYMRKLAGEIITGEVTESFSNSHTERGKEMEDEARQTYAFINSVEPELVGFIRNGEKGASPDSLIGVIGGLEIKTALPHIQIDRLERNRLPPEHKAQVQGNLWISDREWWDFVSYWPRLPMLCVRVFRDEDYIKTMSDEIDRFNDEKAALIERIRSYGQEPAKEAA